MKTVIFMGSPDFAVAALQTLIDNPSYDVKLVVTQPDKPQGRHQVLTAPPVKELALQYGIDVFQPDSMRTDDTYEKLAGIKPNFIVVSAYGKILPQRVLDIPLYGCVNLHGSLLPSYRGAAPIQWSVINGDKITGVTSMLMNSGMDTGDILLKSETEILPEETAGELFDRLAGLCPELLIKTLKAIENGEVVPQKQDESRASYVTMLTKEMSVIDWKESAVAIHNKIRGMAPWPVAKTYYNGKILKLYSSRVSDVKFNGAAGEVKVLDGEIFVSCGDNSVLRICELQLEGSKRMTAEDFIRGREFAKGQILG